jgi:hypothetical protein
MKPFVVTFSICHPPPHSFEGDAGGSDCLMILVVGGRTIYSTVVGVR